MTGLRKILEHISDAEWLRKHSTLASVYFAGLTQVSTAAQQPHLSGVRAVDEQIASIWRNWCERGLTSLQRLFWEGVRKVQPKGNAPYQALLLLTYFQDPRPKQSDVIKTLAISRATYYRYLEQAIEALEDVLLEQLGPSLRLEAPKPKPMVGRESERRAICESLRDGHVVALLGPSGFGKTTLAAHVAATWGRPVFWHTFRPGLTDNLTALLFALAYFLYQNGAPSLWMQFVADAGANARTVTPDKAMAIIRKSLEDLRHMQPLLCFDECERLLPDDLEDPEHHVQVRGFLEDLAQSSRYGAPLLLISQRLVIECEHAFALGRFGMPELQAVLRQAKLVWPDDACQRLLIYTRGNPLLLRLLITLLKLGDPVAGDATGLAATASLDLFVTRIRSRMSAQAFELLCALSVFDTTAPAEIWRNHKKTLNVLSGLGLVESTSPTQLHDTDPYQVALHPALRDAVYRQLPDARKCDLHLSAAEIHAGRREFTAAARQYVLGNQPEMAVWIWFEHREHEIRQGQAGNALALFQALRPEQLAEAADRKTHALLLAELYKLTEQADSGLSALDRINWGEDNAPALRMQELRGALLTMRGDNGQALDAYRRSLDASALG